MNKFSDIKNIDYIINTLLPKLQKYGDCIDHFHRDNKDMKSSIRAFDDSISTKANKIELNICKEEMN